MDEPSAALTRIRPLNSVELAEKAAAAEGLALDNINDPAARAWYMDRYDMYLTAASVVMALENLLAERGEKA